jgi:uncharacterized Fe-S cluster-containing radical SAM superfamily protein
MNPPRVQLSHLDNLWLQVTGTLCNLACTHCFNGSGPNVRTFGFLAPGDVQGELDEAARLGVREIFFTGGEPFLHPALLEMLENSLWVAPTTVLTNATILTELSAARLAEIEGAARYSLEIRVSLDSPEEGANDAIRGAGVFERVLGSIERLCRHGLLPVVTVVRGWRLEREPEILARFTRLLSDRAGYDRPRIKFLPALPLGRELVRIGAVHEEPLVTEEMLRGFDTDLLMCSNSRVVTDRGVWVCPLLVEMDDARLGDHLADAAPAYGLSHRACYTCYEYGTFCSNVSPAIEGVARPAQRVSRPEP